MNKKLFCMLIASFLFNSPAFAKVYDFSTLLPNSSRCTGTVVETQTFEISSNVSVILPAVCLLNAGNGTSDYEESCASCRSILPIGYVYTAYDVNDHIGFLDNGTFEYFGYADHCETLTGDFSGSGSQSVIYKGAACSDGYASGFKPCFACNINHPVGTGSKVVTPTRCLDECLYTQCSAGYSLQEGESHLGNTGACVNSGCTYDASNCPSGDVIGSANDVQNYIYNQQNMCTSCYKTTRIYFCKKNYYGDLEYGFPNESLCHPCPDVAPGQPGATYDEMNYNVSSTTITDCHTEDKIYEDATGSFLFYEICPYTI
ncbi:MAG: hypothetical protein LBJ18_04045 [Rickettsiales bacterium]|jgi:hypothetical protein|nr:hypothetical protein [Rickettsiales bacterium]